MDAEQQKQIEETYAQVTALFNAPVESSDKMPPWEVPEGFTDEKLLIDSKTEKGEPMKVPVDHIIPKDKKSDKIIFMLHGGAYITNLINSYRSIATLYSSKLLGGGEVFAVDYRVSPNHYPAALDDAVAAYKWILNKGYDNKKIFFIGDSAGGHLVITTCLYLKDKGIALPKAVIAISPWGNPACDSPSYKLNFDKDLMLGSKGGNTEGDLKDIPYIQNADFKNDPYVSPYIGNFKGYPNLLIQAGGYELLVDDAKMIEEKAKKDGANVKLSIFDGMSHGFQLIVRTIEPSIRAWKEMKEFIEQN